MTKKLVTAKTVITDAEFRYFVRCVSRWQVLFNLGDWRISVSPKPAVGGVLAQVSKVDLGARMAVIRLARDWGIGNPINEHTLDETACHEVGHIFLHEYAAFLKQPGANEDDQYSIEHRVVQTLTRVLVPDADMRALMKALGVK